jgi:DNA-binding transcriptional ArsR family regulator
VSITECDLLSIDFDKAVRLRGQRLSAAQAEAAAERGKAVSDPLRVQLLSALAEASDLCVCDLSWITERPDKLVSHHLRLLRSAGLVASRREGKLALYVITEVGRESLASAVKQFGSQRASRGVRP